MNIPKSKLKTKHLLLLLIVIVAFVLRFYKLGIYPALNADEAALGYNAYSLLKTGMDEHGNKWPLYFQSFNDYKPALTGYLMMPFISIFGLTEWSVRFLPTLLSTITIPVLYLLVRRLFKEERFALASAFLLAVNPWHIHFSRGAWEVSVATFFVTLATYLFYKGLSSYKYFYLSVVLFVLSLYTYHAARIYVPLLVFGLVMLNLKSVFEDKKRLLISGLLGIILCIPILLSFLGGGGLARAGGVALWADNGPLNRANELRGDYQNPDGIIPKILHNKPVAYSIAFLNNYTEHFWGEFLFLSGDDIQRNKVPETGQLYLIELVFILASLTFILKKLDKNWKLVLWWLLIAPIPAAITFQSPHALRAENMTIPLSIISGYGLFEIINLISKHLSKLKKVSYLGLSLVMLWFIGNYLHEYYVHMSQEFPFSSQYGVKELANYLRPMEGKYKNIIVTDRYDQPYILFLFYGVEAHDPFWEPANFQNNHELTARDTFGFSTVREYKNFRFESIKLSEFLEKYPDSLIIGTDSEILNESNIIKDIYGTNDYRYFRIVEN